MGSNLFDANLRIEVVAALLKEERLSRNIPNHSGDTALSIAAEHEQSAVLELLLADGGTMRTRPSEEEGGAFHPVVGVACEAYDAALLAVKRPRNARFRGLARLVVVLRRMRLRAAMKVYAPGGAGYAAAAANFATAVNDL